MELEIHVLEVTVFLGFSYAEMLMRAVFMGLVMALADCY
jgi:hypothetical protein